MANLLQETARGVRARALLDSEIYKEAVGVVRQAIIDKWASSPVGDRDGQHELRLMLKALNDIEANIVQVANTGKLAEEQIRQEQTLREKAINFARKFR